MPLNPFRSREPGPAAIPAPRQADAPRPPAADDLGALRKAAEGGSSEAVYRLGSALLVGDEEVLGQEAEGLALVTRAADDGHADATTQLATLAAVGGLVPQSWPGAFDLLARAAEGGSEWARRQLLILSGDRALVQRVRSGDTPTNAWRQLRDGIALQAWVTPPPKQRVWEVPRIRVAEGVAAPEVCDWLIERSRHRLHAGVMYDVNARKASWQAMRSCTEYQFDIARSDVVIQLLWAKIAALVGFPSSHLEPPRIFHYDEGEEIKGHYDLVYGGVARGPDLSITSERVATTLVYLNDDFEGGELDFPKAGFRYKGKKGDAVFFASVDAAGKPEQKSYHAGLPVTRGEKWLLSQWIHDQPFRG